MKSRMNTIIACVLLLSGTCAYCESANGQNRAFYEELNEEGYKLGVKGEIKEARYKWEQVAQWANSRTNDVLRYKSVGNLLCLDMELLDKCTQIKKSTYHRMMLRLKTLEQIGNAKIAEWEWGQTDPKELVELAKEVRAVLSNVQSRIVADSEINDNPYYLPMPYGMLRGGSTAVMSPLNISLTFHITDRILDATYSDEVRYNSAAQKAEDESLLGLIRLTISLTGGIIGSGVYIAKDACVGLADFCTLGWAGNCFYDEETSPWWWQRFGKARLFR